MKIEKILSPDKIDKLKDICNETPEIKAFVDEYLRYIDGGPKPSEDTIIKARMILDVLQKG